MRLRGDIVFSSGSVGDNDIWRLHLETRELTQLTTGSANNEQPRWSPSGARIAFISNRDNGIPKLFLMDQNGGNLIQLVKGDHYCDGVCWFPDGQNLLFAANLLDSNEIDLFSINITDSENPTRIMAGYGIESGPSIAPDSGNILYCVASSPDEPGLPRNYDIWEYDIRSATRRQMTDHLLRDFSARYSPDGRFIAFISQRSPENESALVEAITRLQRLVIDGAPIREIDDGIRAVQALEQHADLWLIDRHHLQQARQMTNGQLIASSFTWSPNGRYICYAASEPGGNGATRLFVLDIQSGESEALEFDRKQLKVELRTNDEHILKRSGITALIPDFLKRRMIPRIVYGSEFQPDWRER
jgi:Tol biopolymer transport system component